jgi:hypothetical protein
MTSATAATGSPVTLTAHHPLQRAGAFALAALARRERPDQLSEADFQQASAAMLDDLLPTIAVEDAKVPGGFWLGVSQKFWPNSPTDTTRARKIRTPRQREDTLREWRKLPGPETVIGVPCNLCGGDACGFYGKVDVPLGASKLYRNTTARGHDGLALCRGCLLSFHALPYACAVANGRASLLHSWDNDFMARTVGTQVRRMRRDAVLAAGVFGAKIPYARQVAALRRIRGYSEPVTAGIDLMVFSNSNREQALEVHSMSQPLAEWIRAVHYEGPPHGWQYLVRAHHGAKIRGQSALARNLFDDPRRIVQVAAAYLTAHAEELKVPPGETPDLAATITHYAIKVLDVTTSDADQIRQLAENVAAAAGESKGEFGKFVQACRERRDLQQWLRRQAIGQVKFTKTPDAFVTERQWRLLFDAGDDGFLNRDLLLICVLEAIHRSDPKWRENNPDARRKDDDDGADLEEKDL